MSAMCHIKLSWFIKASIEILFCYTFIKWLNTAGYNYNTIYSRFQYIRLWWIKIENGVEIIFTYILLQNFFKWSFRVFVRLNFLSSFQNKTTMQIKFFLKEILKLYNIAILIFIWLLIWTLYSVQEIFFKIWHCSRKQFFFIHFNTLVNHYIKVWLPS